ncbi:MAG: serine hydrolase domain-containing protein [Pseudomonadota bacterium]
MSIRGLRSIRGAIAISALLFATVSPAINAALQEITTDNLRSWADERLGKAVSEKRLSGAAFGVIKDDEVLFLDAYGWEDPITKVPLDAERSMMRMCSLSKSFTALSALQLIERGQFPSLDTPVNSALERYQLPPPWGDQVTLRQIMTHTSGMTGGGTPQGAHTDIPTPVSPEELQRLLRENLLRGPGEVALYANLAVATEGVLIEDVSGQVLADYMAENTFAPLGMDSTILHHSVKFPDHMATPAAYFPNGDAQLVKLYPKHPSAAASGGITATAADMLRYAAFHAGGATPKYDAVLSRDMRNVQQQTHFRASPLVDGSGLHFKVTYYGDYKVAAHGCGLPGFASYIAILPDLRMGVYFTLMGTSPVPSLGDLLAKLLGRGRLVETDDAPTGPPQTDSKKLWRSFAETFLPPRVLPQATPGEPGPNDFSTAELAGEYWAERRSFDSVGKVFAAGNTMRIQAPDARHLIIGKDTFESLGRNVFQQIDDKERRVVFKRLSDGTLFRSWDTRATNSPWRKVSGLSSPTPWAVMLALSFFVVFTSIFTPLWRVSGSQQATKRLGLVVGSSLVLMLVAALWGTDTLADWGFQYYQGDTTRITIMLISLNVAAFSGAFITWHAVRGWSSWPQLAGVGPKITLVHATLIGVFSLTLLASMVFFNLLGVNLT